LHSRPLENDIDALSRFPYLFVFSVAQIDKFKIVDPTLSELNVASGVVTIVVRATSRKDLVLSGVFCNGVCNAELIAFAHDIAKVL